MKFKVTCCVLVFMLSAGSLFASEYSYLEIDQKTTTLFSALEGPPLESPMQLLTAVDVVDVNLDFPEQSMGGLLFVTSLNGEYVDYGEYVALSVPFRLQSEEPITEIVVKSHYVKPDSGEGFVLFPLVTTLDASSVLIETLEPKEGSIAKGNTVYNYFNLPPRTKYVVVHSRPDFISAQFLESVGEESIDGVNAATGVASALGGVFGGLFVGIWSNSQVERGEVALAPIGIIQISKVD